MLEGLFELTVIFFFELTNYLVMFQTMINNILQDLINTRKVVSFIDDIIVGIEEEKEYNEVVEEVVKRLVENDLYVKPEKYKQNVKKMRFLEVVIGPKGINIEKKKVKEALNWLALKKVKDIQKFLGLTNYYWQFIKDFMSTLLENMYQKQKWKRQIDLVGGRTGKQEQKMTMTIKN